MATTCMFNTLTSYFKVLPTLVGSQMADIMATNWSRSSVEDCVYDCLVNLCLDYVTFDICCSVKAWQGQVKEVFAMSMHDHKPNEYHYIDIIHFVCYINKEGPKEAKRTLLSQNCAGRRKGCRSNVERKRSPTHIPLGK